jgi:uncharacterized protein (DUF362 family)/NAD-dependent dihydropyrimidine dehydrogenase PreA subunit
MTRVLIIPATYSGLDRPVARILNTFPRPLFGKKVLLKVNMLGPFHPDRGTTTHPSLVKAVARQLVASGARVTVGDTPGALGYGRNEDVARKAGFLPDLSQFYTNLSTRTRAFKVASRFVNELVITRDIFEADIVISLPKFKTHMQTVLTGAIKNNYGTVAGSGKSRLHTLAPEPSDFGEVVVDIYRLRPPDLVIVDAIVGMEGNGPSGGNIRDIGLLLASDNGTAVDGVMAAMMGVHPERVPMLKVAGKRNLGPIRPVDMTISGDLKSIKNWRLPPSIVSRGLLGTLINRLGYRPLVRPWPHITTACTACGICADNCPVGVIRMRNIAVIDRDKCIRCYCCHELCPDRAVGLTGMVKRMTSWK